MVRTRLRRALPLALPVGIALLATGCSQDLPLDTLDPAGRANRYIDDLIKPVFLVAGVVLLLVTVGIVYLSIRFHRRPGEDDVFPQQIHGNTRLELTWTMIPALILAVIAVFTVSTLFKLTDTPKDTQMTVRVEGQQWWWSFRYDMDNNGSYDDPVDITTPTEMVIPAGKPVALKITSNDVIHSFWIPKLNGKKDAVPGRIHDWWIEADKPGYYLGQCTEFCGLSHGYMRMAVRAMSQEDFDNWVKAEQQPAQLPTDPAAKRGLETFVSQCSSCHQIHGVNTTGCQPLPAGTEFDEATFDPATECYKGVSAGWTKAAQVSGNAPNLTHLMSRERFIGGLYDLHQPDGSPAVNTIAAWIRNPEDFKAMAPTPTRGNVFGRGMPKLPLTEDQIHDVVAYLTTLK
jgi:cytochrome c oxidase subunit 2